MEPTAQRPTVPTAATKPANGAAPPKPAPPPALSTQPRSRRMIVMMSIGGVLVGSLTLVMLYFAPPAPQKASAGKANGAKRATPPVTATTNGGDGETATSRPVNPAPPAASTAGVSPASSRFGPPAPAVMTEPGVPKWTGGLQNAWSKHPSAAYELTAENQVALLAKRVRPVLTVRCEAGRTEVFVLTESAAVIEGDDGKHTVRVGFDDGADLVQRWLASADYDALFAPDAVRLAQQIAGSRRMRFGFTPYGAAPVVAQFDVTGFNALIGTIAKACRWQ